MTLRRRERIRHTEERREEERVRHGVSQLVDRTESRDHPVAKITGDSIGRAGN